MGGVAGTLVYISLRQWSRHELGEGVQCLPASVRLLGNGEASDECLDVLDLGVRGGWVHPLRVEDVLADLAEEKLERDHASRKLLGVVALDGEGDELDEAGLGRVVCVAWQFPSEPGGEGGIVERAVVRDGVETGDTVDVVPLLAWLAVPEDVVLEGAETSAATVASTDESHVLLEGRRVSE